jgi:hypothetical protein
MLCCDQRGLVGIMLNKTGNDVLAWTRHGMISYLGHRSIGNKGC